jgi:ABC-2 type transport system permease protein
MGRYLQLLGIAVKSSLLRAVQYRGDLLLTAFMSVFWVGWSVTPLLMVYRARPSVAGWTQPEALLVFAWYTALKGLLEGAINPSLQAAVEHIRKGTLDFVLLKPADAQFLVSTQKFSPARVADLVGALGLLLWAFAQLHRPPHLKDIALASCLLLAAVAVLYSLWIVIIAASFWAVRLDNLSYLLSAVFDVARWPSSIFRGWLRLVFTFIIPTALMTTYPAAALLGRLERGVAVGALAGAALFTVVARRTWRAALTHYTSAS